LDLLYRISILYGVSSVFSDLILLGTKLC
jgi:hypothetical protein